MFCDATLAARIDRAEARQMVAIARGAATGEPGRETFVVPVGQGSAVFAGPNSPTNKMIGIGFGEALDPATLDDVEARFAARGARLQAEVSALAEPDAHALLASRGYAPAGFEHVLGHPMGSAIGAMPHGVLVETVAPRDLPALCEALVGAFGAPDVGGVGGDAIPPADEIRRWFMVTMSVDGFRGYIARVDGAVAGGGSLRIDGDIAQFSGAGTLPRFRRRGVQTAIYRARLADARDAGCTVGVVVTQPGSKSQQNAQREGFSLLYARQLLVKAPPGAPRT